MASWRSYWGAIGVAELLVLGTLFFLFPEPITSVFGIALVVTAAAVWVAGWYRGSSDDEREERTMEPERTTTEERERRVRR